jgi:uncharacterized protein YuzE
VVWVVDWAAISSGPSGILAGASVKLHYYPETDSLYIDLSERIGADSREVAEGVVLDFDDEGNVVGIDIDHASAKLNLRTLEVQEFPVGMLK